MFLKDCGERLPSALALYLLNIWNNGGLLVVGGPPICIHRKDGLMIDKIIIALIMVLLCLLSIWASVQLT